MKKPDANDQIASGFFEEKRGKKMKKKINCLLFDFIIPDEY